MDVEFYGDRSNPQAIVIRAGMKIDGIEFFSPQNYSQQVGLMTRPAGYSVAAHFHNPVERLITSTQEVLIMRKGECNITLFDAMGEVLTKIHLFIGDAVLLAHGAHQIDMISECEILEVKQGPYTQGLDKTYLDGNS